MIDTNVIVSGLRSSKGSSFRVLQGVRSGRVRPVVSQPVFLEYEDVLGRRGMIPEHMPAPAVTAFLDAFLMMAEIQEIYFRWRPWLPDPKDECILEAAVAAGCVPIVPNNLRDFFPASQLNVRVMTPWELVCELNL